MLRRTPCSLHPCGPGEAWIGVPVVLTLALAANGAVAQPLGDALSDQLFAECRRLLVTDRASQVLIGPLEAICRQGILSPIPTSELIGADTALAGDASGQQQRLLRDVGQPETRIVSTENGQGASADTGTELARLRLFASAGLETLDRDQTRFDTGYESHISRLVGGIAYSITPAWEAGIGAEYLRQEGDFDAGGDLETKAYGLFAFLSGAPVAGLRTTLLGEYLASDFERTQVVDFPAGDILVNGPIRADYDGDVVRASGLASYRNVRGRFSIEPFAAIDWAQVEYESYSQEGDTGVELHFDRDRQTSLISTVGLSAGLWFRYGPVGFSPSVTAAWKHEFENDQRLVSVSFVNDLRSKRFFFETEPPDRDFGELNASLTALLPNGMQPYVVVQTLVEHSFFDSYSSIVGLSYSF